MKKAMIALISMLTIAASGKAMSYEQARNEALFLTDKMAYELNLSDEQYEAAYEINLDYLMGVTSYDDVYGDYWERRNRDLSYVLLESQWNAFIAASYFYRPLYWSDGFWHFGIYARYPHRDYFIFGRPAFYASYRGTHAWHVVGGHGYYHGRRSHFRPTGRPHHGMVDRLNRDRHHGSHFGNRPTSRPNNHHNALPHGTRPNHGSFGGSRSSSTRTTVHNNGSFGGNRNNGSFGGNRNNGSFGGNRNNGNIGGSHNSGNTTSHSSGSFGGSRNSGSFSGSRNSGSFSGSRNSGSFSGSRSHGGSSSSSRSGGSGRFGR